MDREISGASGCDIRRHGEEGNYTYSVTPEFANRPASHVGFWDACRFCSWLHNGQGDGDTEDGAYTLKGYRGTDGRKVRRNPGAKWFVPNEDEWYKAAYCDPHKSGGPGYWDYPTRSDAKPNRDFAGSNAANYHDGGLLDTKYDRTAVGAFSRPTNAHGTFDQAGNVYEWTEGLIPPFLRCLWGGSADCADGGRNIRAPNDQIHSNTDHPFVGFRVAGALPGTSVVSGPLADSAQGTEAAKVLFPRRPWRDPDTGRPFFPLGWFTWDSDEAGLDAMVAEGVNTVVFVSAPTNVDDDVQLETSIYRMKQYLDHAHRVGIKVLPQVGGWYGAFLRLDLVRDIDRPDSWLATWRIWNAARTVEKRGSVVLQFDVDAVAWATLGSAQASAEGYAGGRIRVGSIHLAGPPPALETPLTFSAVATSQLDGWQVGQLLDGDPNTVYSSHGHGEQSRATEWVAFDFGLAATVSSLQITPRAGGLCFPVDYEIQYSTDMADWHTVPGQVHRGQPRPEGVVTHVFAAPVRARGLRVHATRLGSDGPDGAGNHYLQLADLEVPRLKLDTQPWIRPAELRHKSVNSTGIFSNVSLEREDAPTPKYLAEHPEYLANHPFDGVTIPVLIDGDYTRSQGIVTRSQVAFQEIGMSSLPIPWSAMAGAVADLRRVAWGHCTDNFMWCGVSNFTNHSWEDGDRAWWVDPQSADDWQVVVHNAAVAARAAREAGLKGFLVDTEQYTKYPIGDHPEYPWGLGEAAMWTERGRQWIEAVQGEYPDIVVQFFFSWGDEFRVWPHYQNLVPFMNGVLAGVRHPARIVHAFESTFWNGQSRETPPGTIRHYPGDREPFAAARHAIRNVWRNEADDPAKYDDFVDVGMAAWVESDPWNLWPGLPTGFLGPTAPLGRSSWPSMPWSNLAATLAYSDQYVWTWSEKTNYPATALALNPFLASIAKQTFNTGTEAVRSFREDFAQDPLTRGWYFDFSFMEIGRRKAPRDGPPQMAMTTDAVAYAWSPTDRVVHVRGHWTRREFGELEGLAVPQRRRYVRPITPLTRRDDIRMEMGFTIEEFGQDTANPILLGLFHSEAPADTQTLCVRAASDRDISLIVAGDGVPWSLPLVPAEPLSVGCGYRAMVAYQAATRRVSLTLVDRSSGAEVSKATETLPATVGPFVLDEAGVAQREEAFAATAAGSYRFRLDGFQLHPPQPVAADH